MNFTITREMERLERGMNFLASIGSVSPFIGLLGTVWGIMSSFQSIAESKEHQLGGCCTGNCRGAICHRAGPRSGHSRCCGLQQICR